VCLLQQTLMITAILDQVFRREGGRVLAGLIRFTGDFDLAEDALQDAFARALVAWPRDGLPQNPGAWLSTAARRRAVDLVRRRKTRAVAALPDLSAPADDGDAETGPVATSGVEDDRLRLLFTCCHPALAQPAQVALALRTLGGLGTRDIARAFIEPEPTTAQRLVRAKQKIRDARIPYEIPRKDDLPERLAAVLACVYLIFNEGHTATAGPSLVRPDLCAEATRLARLVVELLPHEPEAKGLLALVLLTDARRPARMDAAGLLVPLEDQDRSLWDRDKIREGTAILDTALPFRRPGPYQIQAAVAALHAAAPAPERTDWHQIAALYGALLRHAPTPVVELNAAVALAMAEGVQHGLDWIASLEERGELAEYHLLPAAKADLLRRAGRSPEAGAAYRQALALVSNPAERGYLERRLREVSG
jgi:RNA polymerase sigma-70 factor (ECF subfamily)